MGRSRARKKRAKEEEDVNAAEVAMAKAVQRLQEIFSEHSEQVIRAMLLECNMKENFAIHRLLAQQDANNEQGATSQLADSSTTTTTSSVLVPNQSAIRNGESSSVPISSVEAVPSLSVPSSSDVTNGETKSVPVSSTEAVPSLPVPSSSSDLTNGETRSVPVSSTEAVPSSSSDVTTGETESVPVSSTEAVPSFSVPSSSDVTNGECSSVAISSTEAVLPSTSDITNGETRSVPVSSSEAVPPLSVPSSRPLLTKVKPYKIQESRIISASDPSWVELLMGLHGPSKQNVTKAPLKADDSPLKPDATNPISKSFTESDAARDPQHSAFPMDTTRQQSTAATASSLLGPRPQTSMSTDGPVPSGGQYGNMMNSPISWRPPPIQPPGRSSSSSNSNTLAHHVDMMNSPNTWLEPDDASIYESLESVFAPYRNCTLSLSTTNTVPSSHGFDMSGGDAANSRFGHEEDVSRNHFPSYSPSGSTSTPSSHGSAFGFDVTSGNDENLRLGYEDVSRSHFPSNSIDPSPHVNGSNSRLGYGDYLPPVHLQGISSFVWRVEGEDSYGSTPLRSQQEREPYSERIRADVASSTDEENKKSDDPSDQTQQRPRDE